MKIDTFTQSYIDSLIWSSGNEYDEADISPLLRLDAIRDCRIFQVCAGELYNDDVNAGHNFALTRNGHGAGFWDVDYPEHGDRLTEIAQSFGEVWLYIGDDGLIYSSN